MKIFIFLLLLTILSIALHAQSSYKVIRSKLPFSSTEKEYYVKQVGNKYVLNGDIIIGNAGQSLMMYQSNNHDGAYVWPKGYVPVRIDNNMKDKYTTVNELLYDNALYAITTINANTNIRLIPYTTQKDYIRIMYTTDTGYGGVSPIGRRGGEQIVYITRQANTKTIIHELLHSLCFWHEQSRYDRDQYVQIDTLNMAPEHRHNFQIEPGTPTTAYDYRSIMHYKSDAFALDKSKPTIQCKNGHVVSNCILGESNGFFSDQDIAGINATYWFNKDVVKRDYVSELPVTDVAMIKSNFLRTGSKAGGLEKATRQVDKVLEDGVYLIKILGTAKYLDIAAVSKENGAVLQQWDKVGWDNQKFAVMNLGNSLCLLKAMHSQKYLNVTGQSREFRANVSQSDYIDQDNFKFYIRYEASKKGYTIQGLQSTMFWTVLNINNGDKIVQEPQLKEYFEFEKIANLPPVVNSLKMKKNLLLKKQ